MKWHKSFPQMKDIEEGEKMSNEKIPAKKGWSRSKQGMVMFVGFGMLLIVWAAVVLGAK